MRALLPPVSNSMLLAHLPSMTVHFTLFFYWYTKLFKLFLSFLGLRNGVADEVSTEHWKEIDNYYGFVYSHPKKGSKKILVQWSLWNIETFDQRSKSYFLWDPSTSRLQFSKQTILETIASTFLPMKDP